MANGFGEFAAGFAGSFERGIERRRLRDVMALEQKNKERGFQLQERGYNLEERRLENTIQNQGLERQIQEKRVSIEEKRLEMEKRQADLQAMDAFTKLGKIPKPARKLFLKQLAPAMGIDPNSPEFQDVVNMIGQLSPEELDATTKQLMSIFPTLEPGKAAAFARGVISGQLSLNDAMTAIGDAQKMENRKGPQGGSGPSMPKPPGTPGAELPGFMIQEPSIAKNGSLMDQGTQAGQQQEDESQPTTAKELRARALELTNEATRLTQSGDEDGATRYEAQARNLSQIADDMDAGREFDPEAVEKRTVAEATGKEKARKQLPIRADVADLLGIKGAGKLSVGDAEAYGIYPELVGPENSIKIRKTKAGTKEAMDKIDNVVATVLDENGQPRDEIVGFLGSAVRGLDGMLSQITAAPRLLGYIQDNNISRFANSKEIKQITDSTGLAGASAILKSRMTELAFIIARAREEGRLSNQDVEQAMNELSASSGSGQQMVTVLEDLRERIRAGGMSDIEAATGMRPIDLMTPNELNEMATGDDTPDWMLKAILVEQNKRLSRRRK